MLFAPLGAFYFYIYVINDSDLEEARKDNLMFPKMENIAFTKIWTEGLFKLEKINRKALWKIFPDLAMMIVVCLLDCLLKLSSTESKLPLTVDKDYEIKFHGIGNFITFLQGSSVGYMQLKFNVINFGVMGNTKDRRGGYIYAVLCGIFGFFYTINHFNYLPRFFLGILLFFAGTGFVAENLWGSRMFLSFREWIQILVILAVFIITDTLLYAVIVGGIVTGFDFIIRYAKVPCTSGNPLRGGELVSRERHNPVLQRNLQHIASCWLLIIKLKGFVFFASAQKLTQYIRAEIQSQAHIPEYRRLKFITIDCQLLDGMDASAAKAMKKLDKEARSLNMRLIWSHVEEKFVTELTSRGLIESTSDLFQDLDEVKTYVEQHAIEYRTHVQKKWLQLHPSFMLAHQMMRLRVAFEPFAHVFQVEAMRRGCPWQYCGVLQLKAFETVLWKPGQRNQDLFLIHSGSVGIFHSRPESGADWGDDVPPMAIYRHGWFLNREVLVRAPTRDYAVACADGEALFWNERQFARMAREAPFMASAISKMVMKQQASATDIEQLVVRPEDMPVFDELLEEEECAMNNHFSLERKLTLAKSRTLKTSTSYSTLSPLESATTADKSLHPSSSPASRGSAMVYEVVSTAKGIVRNFSSQCRSVVPTPYPSSSCVEPYNAEGLPLGSEGSVVPPAPVQPYRATSADDVASLSLQSEVYNGSPGAGPIKELFVPRGRTSASSQIGSMQRSITHAGRFVEQRNANSLLIPEQLQHRLNGIQTAQVFDRINLYDSVAMSEKKSLPAMPKSFQADLEIAFSTYCEVDEGELEAYLDQKYLSAALMYAGIFNTVMRPGTLSPDRKFTLKDFLEIGHRATMATLNEKQDAQVEEIFEQFDSDGSGDFDRYEMIEMFRKMFHPDISIEEVDSVADAWMEPNSVNLSGDRINRQQFRAIMSHFIREHEQDWNLLCGFRELFGKDTIANHDTLTAATMVRNSLIDMSLDEAQELLWVADWRLHGRGDGESLEFADVVAAVLLDTDSDDRSKLPPKPKIPRRQRHSILQMSLPESHVPEKELDLPCEEAAVDDASDIPNVLVDLRDKDYELKQIYMWAKLQAPTERQSTQSDVVARTSTTQRTSDPSMRIVEKHDTDLGVETRVKVKQVFETIQPGADWRIRMYCLVEEPQSSRAAEALSLFMGTMIMASVFSLVLQPLTQRQDKPRLEEDVWFGLELFFTIVFTIELLVRWAVADAAGRQSKLGFFMVPSNICDLCAVVPYYVEAILDDQEDQFKLLRVARLMRLSRVMRLAKLSNRSTLIGPVAMVLTVIWGIYLKHESDENR
jgi:Ca2+-binding EF-hand superfamily protein